MGVRTRTRAENRKEAKKNVAFAKLNNCPTSPRKMRLIADLIRGKRVELLLSAIANWQTKNEGSRIEDSDLIVKEVFVDSGRQLKRLLTAPQGRAHRIRKRSNHVTILLDSRNKPEVEAEETEEVEETKK
jgi:large subunit ribosomal protein L22